MSSTRESLPWYREPWPWLLMAGPAAVVVAGIYTTALAIRSDDGLVAEDYYRKGMEINRQLAREERARGKNIHARIEISGDRVRIDANADMALPPTLRLRIVHPTRAGEDRIVLVAVQGGNQYMGELPPLSRESRRLILEDPAATWRIAGRLDKSGGVAQLAP